MKTSWRKWKTVISIMLGVLVALDLALIFAMWQSSREAAETLRSQRDRLALQTKLLKADVDRGQKIQASLPQIGKDCDAFFKADFLDAGAGYSAIVADLGQLIERSGLKTSGLTFQQNQQKVHGVVEVGIKAAVQGDYLSLIRFINDLEHSKNFYLLDNLHLDSGNQGGIRLSLDLRTYFRT